MGFPKGTCLCGVFKRQRKQPPVAEPRGPVNTGVSSFEEATHLLDDYFQERDPSCEAAEPPIRGQTNVCLCSGSDSAQPHGL